MQEREKKLYPNTQGGIQQSSCSRTLSSQFDFQLRRDWCALSHFSSIRHENDPKQFLRNEIIKLGLMGREFNLCRRNREIEKIHKGLESASEEVNLNFDRMFEDEQDQQNKVVFRAEILRKRKVESEPN